MQLSQVHIMCTPLHNVKLMRGFLFIAALSTLIPFSAAAVGNEAAVRSAETVSESPLKKSGSSDDGKVEHLDSVVVSTSRAGKSTPVTYTMMGKEELKRSNPINSLPMNLSLQPSVVTVNEGGTGLGYSKMTIRGSKGSQINVTLNGVTLNDAESQEVFWVNIPSLSSLISSVQVQRGLGTSANGAGAFGASINMSTASVGASPYGYAEFSAGSYNTFTAAVAGGTGLTKSGVYFDAAYTRSITDGYIRNAKARLQSAFAVLGWMNATNSLRLTYLMGDQHTGITWNGITLEQYAIDRRYNETGAFYDEYGNERYYDNDTDNYTQHHIQLNYTHQFERNVTWSTTANFTKGDGYYENYKAGKKFSKYGFREDFIAGDKTVSPSDKGDFVIRKAMDNYNLILNSDVKYNGENLDFTGGISLSRYDGRHFGKLVWSDVLGNAFEGYDSHYWYENFGLKQEAGVCARAEYTPVKWLTAYADLQYRAVFLDMEGIDDEDDKDLKYSSSWHFFNPRAGLSFHWNPRHKAYASVALGHREPGRADIKEIAIYNNEGSGATGLKPEKMVDVEIGYVYSAPSVIASANLYFMEYWDMLLETGRLTDVGYHIKDNVARSYRRGVELAVCWDALKWLRIDANTTLSTNRIKDYSEFIAKSDGSGSEEVHFGNTTMLMSPSVTGMLQLTFCPFRTFASGSLKTTSVSVNGKYVGKQYVNNIMDDSMSIPGYFVSDLSVTHEFNVGGGKLGLGGYVNNLFNNLYYADGTDWGKTIDPSDGRISGLMGIYPQAPINFMLKVSYRF